MSGIFGIVDTRRTLDLARVVQAMADRMFHRNWYRRDIWLDTDYGIAVGRLTSGILNTEPQPAVSREGNVVLMMTGEFIEATSMPQPDHPTRGPEDSDATYALRLYETHGEAFIQYLSGAFLIAIYDRTRQTLILVTDRFGLYPLYYSQRDGYLAFAPEVIGVLQVPNSPRRLDEAALAQYMRFQQLLGTRTFFQDVHLLQFASTLTFDLRSGACRVEPYWSFEQVPPEPPGITFEEAAQEAARLMRLSVKRRLQGNYRTGLYLSGGLDSRIILAAWPREYPLPITLTFGIPDSRDVYYAVRIAARAGTLHHLVAYRDGKWVKDYADFHLALTEGFHTWVHMHGINTLEAAHELFDLNLTGLAGDRNLGGHHMSSSLSLAPDEISYRTRLFEHYNQTYNWPGLTEAEEHTLYTPPVRARTAELAFESLIQDLQPYLKYDRHRRITYFSLTQRDLRHNNQYVTFIRSRVDVRHPFFDSDLLDFLWSLPPHFREGGRLQKTVLNRLNPALALIPVDKDEYLPTERKLIKSVHTFYQKAKRQFNRRVYRLSPERFTLHTDYEGWLRTDLREWGEAILFDRRTLARGIFNPEFIRSIWARHQSGQERWTLGKVAPIMTYEMMLRRFLDEASVR